MKRAQRDTRLPAYPTRKPCAPPPEAPVCDSGLPGKFWFMRSPGSHTDAAAGHLLQTVVFSAKTLPLQGKLQNHRPVLGRIHPDEHGRFRAGKHCR